MASVDFDGEIIEKMTLVDEEGVAVYEPRWTLTGDLIHVDGSNGWANLYRTEGFEWRENEGVNEWMNRLRTRRLHPSERVLASTGTAALYDNLDEEHLICSWTEECFLARWHSPLDNGQLEAWDVDWWPVGNVAADGGRVVMLAGLCYGNPAIVEIQRGGSRFCVPPHGRTCLKTWFLRRRQLIGPHPMVRKPTASSTHPQTLSLRAPRMNCPHSSSWFTVAQRRLPDRA